MVSRILLAFLLGIIYMVSSVAYAQPANNDVNTPTQNSSTTTKPNQGTQESILFVAPYRVVVTKDERVSTLNVANKSSKARRYDLVLVDQVMNESGATQRSTEPFQYSVKRMVRFVPKRFTLQPGERQVIRVQVRRPRELPDGDYHSHLLFREVPLQEQDKSNLQGDVGTKAAQFEIRALYGVAVPIIVHSGEVQSSMSVVGGTAEKSSGIPSVRLTFKREGNAEGAAQLFATYVAPGKAPVQVVENLWVRMYREVDVIDKVIRFNKTQAEKVDWSKGKLVFEIRDSDGVTLSQTEVPL